MTVKMRRTLRLIALCCTLMVLYFLFWPVSVRPVAWDAPEDAGYTGDFAPNDRLNTLSYLDTHRGTGPEDAAIGPDGMVYVATHDGTIMRGPLVGPMAAFARTGGRPLGMEFSDSGDLLVADGYLGLLSVQADGGVTILTDTVLDGSPILYADDVDVSRAGAVYFSDASTRFGAKAHGGTLQASILDLMEHSGSGRILKFVPNTGETNVFASGLNFANGVALSPDEARLLVVETGNYRVLSYDLTQPGQAPVVVIDNLPGFPDNINPAPDGTYWVGLVSPRNPVIDSLSNKPFLRKMVMRLPNFLKPAPTRHGFILRIDGEGRVIETLQDVKGTYALTTGAVTAPDGTIVVTSLSEPRLGLVRP